MLYEYHRACELTGHGRKRCKPTSTKRKRVCEHCGKDITLKIYREHRRLFYNQSNKAWVKDQEEAVSSSEIS